MNDLTAQLIVTLLTVSAMAGLVGIIPAKWLFEGKSDKYRRFAVSAIALATVSQLFTCAAYWTCTLEGVSIGDYETGTTFQKTPITYVLGILGFVLLFSSEFLVVSLVIYKFCEIRAVSTAYIFSPSFLHAALFVLAVVWSISTIGSVVYWADAEMLGEFAGVVPILNILLSVGIAIITVIALHKHAAQLQSKFASAEEFSAKRIRVIVAAVAMSAVHFLTMGAFIVLEELTANPDLLTYAAIMGAAVTSIFTPLAFWVMFHFANEIDTIVNPGGVLETSNDQEEPLLE